jgi:hypothetical protein
MPRPLPPTMELPMAPCELSHEPNALDSTGTTSYAKTHQPASMGFAQQAHHDPMDTDEPFLFSPRFRGHKSSMYRNTEDAGHTPHASSHPTAASVPSPTTPDLPQDSGSPTILWCCVPPASQVTAHRSTTVHRSTTHRPPTSTKVAPPQNGTKQNLATGSASVTLQKPPTNRTTPISRRFPTSPKPLFQSPSSQVAPHRNMSRRVFPNRSHTTGKPLPDDLASFHIQRTDYAPPQGRCRSILEYQSCQARQYQAALARGCEPCTLFELL